MADAARSPGAMSASNVAGLEVIDPSGARQRRIRRNLQRLLLPIAGVTLVIASLVGIGLHTYSLVHASSERLTHDLLAATQTTVAQEVASYLEPVTQGSGIAHDMLQHAALSDKSDPFTLFAGAVLRQTPQVQAFYLANSDGDFELLQRHGDGGVEQVIVSARGGTRRRTTLDTDADGHPTDQPETAPSDYDPRKSLFYTAPLKSKIGWWSDPHIFTPTGQPIVTASVAYATRDERDHVLAVNISLRQLSAFLSTLHIGINGRAVIVRRDGRIIASPALAKLSGAAAVTATLDPAGARGPETPLTRAFEVFRVQGFGPHSFAIGGKPYISIAAKLPAGAADWALLVVVPARDFATFTTNNSRSLLAWSLVTVGLAAILAGFLVYQGRRSDRLLLAIAARDERGIADRRSLRALLDDPSLLDPAAEVPALTEQLCALAAADRAGIWRLGADGTLRCEDLFDRTDNGHLAGLELPPEEAGEGDARAGLADAVRSAADQDEMLDIHDPARDPRTARFHRLHLRGANVHSLMILPVETEGSLFGAIILENARRTTEARPALELVAGIAALRLRQAVVPVARGGSDDERISMSEPAIPSGTSLFVSAAADPGSGGTVAQGSFPSVAVMVAAFGGVGGGVMQRDGEVRDTIALVSQITIGMIEIARRHELFLVRIAGHRLLAASGCTEVPDPEAPVRLAAAALALRDLVTNVLANADIDPVFQIGIDVGRALGAVVGAGETGVFNLWGEAITGAERMAQSNHLPGAIQVTETAQGLLRERFLFRSRGYFYDPAGWCATHLLAGGPAMTQARSDTRHRRSRLHLLATIGRTTRVTLRFLLAMVGGGYGVLREAIRPSSWRRTTRAEFRPHAEPGRRRRRAEHAGGSSACGTGGDQPGLLLARHRRPDPQ